MEISLEKAHHTKKKQPVQSKPLVYEPFPIMRKSESTPVILGKKSAKEYRHPWLTDPVIFLK